MTPCILGPSFWAEKKIRRITIWRFIIRLIMKTNRFSDCKNRILLLKIPNGLSIRKTILTTNWCTTVKQNRMI